MRCFKDKHSRYRLHGQPSTHPPLPRMPSINSVVKKNCTDESNSATPSWRWKWPLLPWYHIPICTFIHFKKNGRPLSLLLKRMDGHFLLTSYCFTDVTEKKMAAITYTPSAPVNPPYRAVPVWWARRRCPWCGLGRSGSPGSGHHSWTCTARPDWSLSAPAHRRKKHYLALQSVCATAVTAFSQTASLLESFKTTSLLAPAHTK